MVRPEWYAQSGVRSEERLVITSADNGFDPFPEELIPVLRHPLLADADADDRRVLQAQHLYAYLQFTTNLEVFVVNRATSRLATSRCGFDLDNALRMEAHRIYVDESFHALSAFDVLGQVSRHIGIEALTYDFTPTLASLDAGAGLLGRDGTRLLELLQVVVYETLVTSLLRDIPRQESVMPFVRKHVAHHAEDEVWHHAFFASFFRELWTSLGPIEREQAARVLPSLIDACVLPDTRSITGIVRSTRFHAHADQVVRETYSDPEVVATLRATARRTLNLFRRVGLFDLPGAGEAFETAGYALPT